MAARALVNQVDQDVQTCLLLLPPPEGAAAEVPLERTCSVGRGLGGTVQCYGGCPNASCQSRGEHAGDSQPARLA